MSAQRTYTTNKLKYLHNAIIMLCVRTDISNILHAYNISDDSTIIHNPVFERAIVKLQGGGKKTLLPQKTANWTVRNF
jgi:hypothetical protein